MPGHGFCIFFRYYPFSAELVNYFDLIVIRSEVAMFRPARPRSQTPDHLSMDQSVVGNMSWFVLH